VIRHPFAALTARLVQAFDVHILDRQQRDDADAEDNEKTKH
jgi:hypothetical protein